MLIFILRRTGWAALTIFGVMLFTFVLFRWFVAGDIAGANGGMKAPEQDKAAWRHRFGYDKPMLLNVHRQLAIFDKTQGDKPFMISDPVGSGSLAANSLALALEIQSTMAAHAERAGLASCPSSDRNEDLMTPTLSLSSRLCVAFAMVVSLAAGGAGCGGGKSQDDCGRAARISFGGIAG